MATIVCPDHRPQILMCYGSGALIFGPLCNWLMAEVGWSRSFLYLGIGIFLIVLVGSFQVRLSSAATDDKEILATPTVPMAVSYTTAQMFGRKSFWLYSLWTTLLSGVNMAIVAQVFTISSQIGLADNISSYMVSLISICCGIGRFTMGTLYDVKGRSCTMNLMSVLMIAGSLLLVLSLQSSGIWILALSFVLLGIGYGGLTPTNSNFALNFYGTKHYALNFSVVNFNLFPAVCIGQFVGSGLYMMTGSFTTGVVVMAVMCFTGLLIAQTIQKP